MSVCTIVQCNNTTIEKVMNVFDQLATKYDSYERIKFANIIANKLKAYLNHAKYKTAIELGCGTGLVGLKLVSCFESMIFIDTSSNMINIISDKIKNAHITNAKALLLDISAKEQPTMLKADCIFMSQVLLHVPDYQLFLTYIFNMLNDSGILYLVDFDKNDNIISDKVHNGFDQTELTRLLKMIGFKHVSSEIFYQGKQIFMNQDAALFILTASKDLTISLPVEI